MFPRAPQGLKPLLNTPRDGTTEVVPSRTHQYRKLSFHRRREDTKNDRILFGNTSLPGTLASLRCDSFWLRPCRARILRVFASSWWIEAPLDRGAGNAAVSPDVRSVGERVVVD